MDADRISIAKGSTRDDLVYLTVKNFLLDLRKPDRESGNPAMSNRNDDTNPSAIDRRQLRQTLTRILPSDFNDLIFVLEVPSSKLPPPIAAQADRVNALLEWAESPTGCGLLAINQELNDILNQGSQSKEKAETNIDRSNPSYSSNTITYPGGAVSLESPLYIKRLDERYERFILQERCILKIKASRGMGKTSLMYRLMDKAKSYGYQIVNLNLRTIPLDQMSLPNFLSEFCRRVELYLKSGNSCQDNEMSPVDFTSFFKDILQRDPHRPLLLCIDNVDSLFHYPRIYNVFFGILRDIHEEAAGNSVLENLRQVIVYSTLEYFSFKNQSPLNGVGEETVLNDFTLEEIRKLVNLHQIDDKIQIGNEGLENLCSWIGGHPYLIRIALYQLHTNSGMTIDQLLSNISDNNGIYGNYLRNIYRVLQSNSQLQEAFKQVIISSKLRRNPLLNHQLISMGLITDDNGRSRARYRLYEEYFRREL